MSTPLNDQDSMYSNVHKKYLCIWCLRIQMIMFAFALLVSRFHPFLK